MRVQKYLYHHVISPKSIGFLVRELKIKERVEFSQERKTRFEDFNFEYSENQEKSGGVEVLKTFTTSV